MRESNETMTSTEPKTFSGSRTNRLTPRSLSTTPLSISSSEEGACICAGYALRSQRHAQSLPSASLSHVTGGPLERHVELTQQGNPRSLPAGTASSPESSPG